MNYCERQFSAFTLQQPDTGRYQVQVIGGNGTRTKYVDLNLEAIDALDKFLKRERQRLQLGNISCCDCGVDHESVS